VIIVFAELIVAVKERLAPSASLIFRVITESTLVSSRAVLSINLTASVNEKVISELVAILTAYARFEVETKAKKHIIFIILDIILLLLIPL
jgi:hypothetical protein